jgi:endo-1,4-beta-xylanase
MPSDRWLPYLLVSFLATLPANHVVGQAGKPKKEPATLRGVADLRKLHVGAAAQPALLANPDYARVLAEQFNQLTPENAMKWKFIHPTPDRFDFEPADQLVEFAAKHNMRIKGHALLWHESLPDSTKDLPADQLRQAVREHIRAVVARYKGKVYAWDVVNEAIGDSEALRPSVLLYKLGPDFIADAFRTAHEADPAAKLIYNDYGTEGLGPKSDRQCALLRNLLVAKVPVHEVGLQMHVTAQKPPNADHIAVNVRRLTALGLRVNISEMDVSLVEAPGDWPTKLRFQATIYKQVIATCTRIKGFEGVTFWGFTDKHTWIDWRNKQKGIDGEARPLLFDAGYQPKPAFQAVREALMGK